MDDLCKSKEVSRNKSLDGKVDAIILQKDCGATTSYSFSVYLLPAGKALDGETPVFIADHVEGIQTEWGKQKKLIISYTGARIFNFTNFWQSKDVDNFNYTVFISINDKAKKE